MVRGREAARRLQQLALAAGGWPMLPAVAAWLLRTEYLVITLDLTAPPPAATSDRPPGDARWALVTEAETDHLAAAQPFLAPAEIRGRLRAGLRCAAVWVNDTIVHHQWYATAAIPLPFLGRELEPRRGDIMLVEAFTHPAFRRQGLLSATLRWHVAQAARAGYRRGITFVAGWHRASLRVHAGMGSRVVGTVGFWRLGSWRRYFATGAVGLTGTGRLRIAEPGGAGRPVAPAAGRGPAGPGR